METFYRATQDWKAAWTAYLEYLRGRKQDATVAAKCLEAIEKFPNDNDFAWTVLWIRQLALQAAGSYDEAIQCIRVQYERFKDDQTILPDDQPRSYRIRIGTSEVLGHIYESQGKYEAAIEEYKKAAAMVTPEVLARYPVERRGAERIGLHVVRPMKIANCYLRLGKRNLATELYGAALEYVKNEKNFAYGLTKEKNTDLVRQRDYYLSKLLELTGAPKPSREGMGNSDRLQSRSGNQTGFQGKATSRPGTTCGCGCGATTGTVTRAGAAAKSAGATAVTSATVAAAKTPQ